jgi:tRNA (mo5U34)-methyltransferase
MDLSVRFSRLIRSGLLFRRKFEAAKGRCGCEGTEWYPYDSFTSLFPLERLRRQTGLSMTELVDGRPLLDIGTGDGALAFFFESLGDEVHACDNEATNINQMKGVRRLALAFDSRVKIENTDLDGLWNLSGRYGLALFLGTLYHLKNPFAALERVSHHANYCFLSSRVAVWNPDRTVELGRAPVAYLVGPEECNGDATNYWVFSPPSLLRLVERSGWRVLASLRTGAQISDPSSAEGDERQFLLLKSLRSHGDPDDTLTPYASGASRPSPVH